MLRLEPPVGPADRRRVIVSPVGDLLLTGNETQLLGVGFLAGRAPDLPAPVGSDLPEDSLGFAAAAEQLAAYFAGRLEQFDLSLAAAGNPFQFRVWAALLTIGYGHTASYGQIAAAIGMPGGARAVGTANHVNPLAIVVPCHRVIGADGSLTGYGGGLPTKNFLLALEAPTLF